VNLEDLGAATEIRTIDHHLTIETSRPEQRRIEHVRPVRRCDENNAFRRVESVHLDQELIEGLLSLVVPTAETRTPESTDGVDFVDENNTRRMLLALFEEIPDTRCADPNEHFDEVRPADAEEGDTGFAGDSLG
jgi:hypothetical protein